MSAIGILRVQLVEAKLTHDTETFGKMDPYCKMEMREQNWKSSVSKNGGLHPEWKDQRFEIEVKELGDDLHFHLWDDDLFRDEDIGKG